MTTSKAIKVAKLCTKGGAAWRGAFMLGDTELPHYLHPFSICEQRDPETNMPTQVYDIHAEMKNGDDVTMSVGHHCPVEAFAEMFKLYRQWLPHRPVEQIYFIGTELRAGRMLKIGRSIHPEARLKQLQTSHGEVLHIFATTPGDRFLEQKYHSRWNSRRRQGEWFVLGDCIINEIERIKTQGRAA